MWIHDCIRHWAKISGTNATEKTCTISYLQGISESKEAKFGGKIVSTYKDFDIGSTEIKQMS